MRRYKIFLAFLALFYLLPGVVRAGEYQFDSWTTDNGLPQDSVRAITRTSNGYLWMGTFEGLVRFDGVNFTVFNNINTPEFQSNFVDALMEDRQGNLWIGIDDGGLVRLTGNRFYHYTKADGILGEDVFCLLEDHNGDVWIGTREGGLSVFRDGGITTLTKEDGLPDNSVWALAEDNVGGLWIGTGHGLAYLKDNKLAALNISGELSSPDIRSLAWSGENELWIGTAKGLNRLKDNTFSTFSQPAELADQWISNLLLTEVGDLLVGTTAKGLYRLPKNEKAAAPFLNDPTNIFISAIYEDADNAWWVGSYYGGLSRFRKGRFQAFSRTEGLPEENVRAVFQDSRGVLWFSSDNYLSQFRNGTFSTFTSGKSISCVAEDTRGNIWYDTEDSVSRVDPGGNITHWTPKDGLAGGPIYSILAARSGDVWIGSWNGLSLFRDGHITVYTTEDGMVNNFVNSLFEDKQGGIWVGSRKGLSYFKDGKFTNWTAADGLVSDHILSFYEQEDGAVWVGTSGGGLLRYKDGKFVNVNSQSGLYDNLAFVMLDDGLGTLWMSGNRGVYRANLQELNDFADGKIASINSYFYERSDGLLNREGNGGSPAGWKTQDGSLWFSTVRGLVRVDPKTASTIPPRVIIEKTEIDGKPLPESENLEINYDQNNLEIHYTGINWARPAQTTFKYKMEGLDSDWIAVGTRRTAYYPHLPAGDYTFRVIADNGEGAWNEEGKSLKIKVLPPFYRTAWFIALFSLAAAGLVYFFYRRRIRQLQKERELQQAFSRQLIASQEQERKRIAAELHDSLGQTMAMIKNRAIFGSTSAADLNAAKEELDRISVQSAQAISEVREIAHNLRPYLLDRLGFTKAVRSMLNKITETNAITVRAELDDIDGLFSKESEMSIYRILQESLNNVLKHAEASEADISIKKNEGLVTIDIRDNGKGFDVNLAKDGEKGGFGLRGMAERVKMLGGTQAIRSELGKGTLISIELAPSGGDHGSTNGKTN